MTDQNWPAPGDPQPPPQNQGTPLPPPQNYGTPQPPPQNYGTPQPPPQNYGTPMPPPQSYALPAYGAPAQEPKKRKVWPWILGLFGLIILGIGGCSYIAFGALTAPVDASNEFLALAQVEDYGNAASRVSASDSCFGSGAEGVLADFFAPRRFTDYDLNSTIVNSVNGKTTAEVSGTIVVGGDQLFIGLALIKESDDWLVCGVEIS